jgi:hypothetical protein
MPDSNQRQAAESVFERNERREAEINQRRTEAGLRSSRCGHREYVSFAEIAFATGEGHRLHRAAVRPLS